jgi:tRNA-dihydrouridine synthase B
MKIGNYNIENKAVLAPMAGVTDLPFRSLCKQLGAGMAPSEMVGSNSLLKGSLKTLRRADHTNEPFPRVVQIVGADPNMLSMAAQFNEQRGAEIIDINMGCPAKKVCNTLAGSALLQNESLVAKILEKVVNSVSIPVTLKIRTGWDNNNKNGVAIAKLAENIGIQAIAIHGRTRCCFFKGEAEYETIAAIKASVKIPVIANGDITNAKKAKAVLDFTKADAVMIGRAAQGNPWIFKQINYYLTHNKELELPTQQEIYYILMNHLECLYSFYDVKIGVLIARKHVSWYCKNKPMASKFRENFNKLTTIDEQLTAIKNFFQIK